MKRCIASVSLVRALVSVSVSVSEATAAGVDCFLEKRGMLNNRMRQRERLVAVSLVLAVIGVGKLVVSKVT